MQTLIFKTMAPLLIALMLVFSVFVLLAGHNAPGGGFIGGLIAACGLAVLGLSSGVSAVRRALRVHPLSIAAAGLLCAAAAGLVSLPLSVPFMTGLWIFLSVAGQDLAFSTPMLFDLGVYLVVVGALTSVLLVLEEREDDL